MLALRLEMYPYPDTPVKNFIRKQSRPLKIVSNIIELQTATVCKKCKKYRNMHNVRSLQKMDGLRQKSFIISID